MAASLARVRRLGASQPPPASPPPVYGASVATSPVAGSQAILSGGFTGQDVFSPASYLWTGSTWAAGPG